MNDLPWSERINMLSINPDAATREDIAKMVAELSAMRNTLKWIAGFSNRFGPSDEAIIATQALERLDKQ